MSTIKKGNFEWDENGRVVFKDNPNGKYTISEKGVVYPPYLPFEIKQKP
jgi:hypothetical protein